MDSSKVKASRVASNGMRMPSVIQQLMTQSEASIGLRCQASTNHRITLQHVEVTKGTPSLIGTTGRSCSYVAQILSIVGWPMEWRIWHRTGGSASPLKAPASWEPHEDFWENKLRCLGGSVSSPVSEASSTMRSKGHCDRGRSTKAFQCLWCKWRVSLQRTKTPRDCWVERKHLVTVGSKGPRTISVLILKRNVERVLWINRWQQCPLVGIHASAVSLLFHCTWHF